MSPPLPRSRALLARCNAWLSARSNLLLPALIGVNFLWPLPALALRDVSFFAVPGTAWSYDFPTLALTLMMLSASVQCRARDFGALLRHRRPAGAFLLLNYVAGPLVAWLVSTTTLAGFDGSAAYELRLGLFFIALMPIALTSAIWVRLSSGNVAFSLAMIGITTLASVVTVPLYIHLMPGDARVSLGDPAAEMVRQLVLSVTLPLCAGLLFRKLLPLWAERAQPLLGILGQVGLYAALSTNIAGAAVRLPSDREILWTASAGTLVLNLALFGLAVVTARALRLQRPGLAHADAIAVVLGCGMRSTGTAMVVAQAAFPALALVSLPAALFSVTQQALASTLRPLLQLGSRLWRVPAGRTRADLDAYLLDRASQHAGRARVIVLRPHPKPEHDEGHEEAMRSVVEVVQRRLRPYDYVSHLDDESIAVVLWDVNDRQVRRIAQRLKRSVETSAAHHVRCRVRTYRPHQWEVRTTGSAAAGAQEVVSVGSYRMEEPLLLRGAASP